MLSDSASKSLVVSHPRSQCYHRDSCIVKARTDRSLWMQHLSPFVYFQTFLLSIIHYFTTFMPILSLSLFCQFLSLSFSLYHSLSLTHNCSLTPTLHQISTTISIAHFCWICHSLSLSLTLIPLLCVAYFLSLSLSWFISLTFVSQSPIFLPRQRIDVHTMLVAETVKERERVCM